MQMKICKTQHQAFSVPGHFHHCFLVWHEPKKGSKIGCVCFLQYQYTRGEHGGDIHQQQFVSLFCSLSHDCSRRLFGNNGSVKAKGTHS